MINTQVFGGFSGRACADRIVDSQSRVLITMDAYWRNGTLGDHKQNADIACELAAKDGQKVDTVLVWQRYPGRPPARPLVKGRDFIVNDILNDYHGALVDPETMPAEAPLSSCTPAAPPAGTRPASTVPAATWPTPPAPPTT